MTAVHGLNAADDDDESSVGGRSTVSSIAILTGRPNSHQAPGVLGVLGGSVILVNTVVGGGIALIATPYATKSLGIAPFAIAELLFGAMSILSLACLARACNAAGIFNLNLLAEHLLGRWPAVVVSIAIAVNGWSVLVAFLQVAFDVGDAIVGDTLAPVLVGASVALIVPLASLAHVDQIQVLATVCTVVWLAFVFMMIVNFFVAAHRGHLATDWLWSASAIDVIFGKGIPALNLTWTVQFNAAPLFGSLTPRTTKTAATSGRIMSAVATSLYIAFGVFVYRYYGMEVKDDIMSSIDTDKGGKGLEWRRWSVYVTESLLGVSCLTTIPFFLIESRNMIHLVATGDEHCKKVVRIAETVCMLAISYLIAYFLDDLSLVFAFIGAIPANIIAWIAPGLLILALKSGPLLPLLATNDTPTTNHTPQDAALEDGSDVRVYRHMGYALITFGIMLIPLGLVSMFR
ncbi:Vacuolar amino acid transporter 5 [Diplonema papillatum]|nr:Vacuolar amino acid transporter 5 [Diplonema papillatum]